MFGCLRRIVVLVVLCVAAVAAYLTRDRWIGYVPWLKSAPRATATAGGPKWEPVSDAGAARARQAIESLGKRSGPVFVSLDPGDLASYFYIRASAPCLCFDPGHRQFRIHGLSSRW